MCILFYFSLVRLSVCAFAIHSMYANLSFKTTMIKQNIKIILIAGVPSSQALPGFLITAPPYVCVPDVIGALACGFQTNWGSPRIDWCCFYYVVRNSLVALLEALCARIFSWDSWISIFPDIFSCFFFLCVCARSLTKPFFRPSKPGSCAWLSPFLLCADCTCVLVCVCLCMCMWKWVGKVINIWQI